MNVIIGEERSFCISAFLNCIAIVRLYRRAHFMQRRHTNAKRIRTGSSFLATLFLPATWTPDPILGALNIGQEGHLTPLSSCTRRWQRSRKFLSLLVTNEIRSKPLPCWPLDTSAIADESFRLFTTCRAPSSSPFYSQISAPNNEKSDNCWFSIGSSFRMTLLVQDCQFSFYSFL